MRSTLSSPRRAALLLLFALVAMPLGANAQGAAKDPRFVAIGSYFLVLDGERVDAEFFHSTASGTIVFKSPELSNWIELHPRGRLIAIYAPEAFHRNADGSYDKLPSPLPTPGGNFELVGKLPRFTVEGKVVTLERRPDLYGPQTAESIMEHDPSYRVRAEAYRPSNQDFLERLKALKEPIRVKIYFGSWCSTCVELLPHIFKVQELLGDVPLTFEYYGIPSDYNDPQARADKVRATPTGLLYSGDQEIGRIEGHSWRFPEISLHNELYSAGVLQ